MKNKKCKIAVVALLAVLVLSLSAVAEPGSPRGAKRQSKRLAMHRKGQMPKGAPMPGMMQKMRGKMRSKMGQGARQPQYKAQGQPGRAAYMKAMPRKGLQGMMGKGRGIGKGRGMRQGRGMGQDRGIGKGRGMRQGRGVGKCRGMGQGRGMSQDFCGRRR